MPGETGYFSDSYGDDEQPSAPEEGKSKAKTALLPLDFFQGKELQPGDTCTIRVEQVMDDQAAVSYVGDNAGEEANEATPAPAQEPDQDDMMG